MNEHEAEAGETYMGNKAAGVRLRKSSRQIDGLCIDMRKALVALHPSGLSSEKGIADPSIFGCITGEDVDVLSDGNEEDLEVELDSDGEGPQATFPSSHKHESSYQQHANLDSMKENTSNLTHSSHAGFNGGPDSTIGAKNNSGASRWTSPVVVLDD